MQRLFASEAVTRGHPDKLCDTIADTLLDQLLREDPDTRAAIDVVCREGTVGIFGELSTRAQIPFEAITRDVIRDAGYTDDSSSFSADRVQISVAFHEQPPEIARCITRHAPHEWADSGSADQGVVFGYAIKETEHFMPCPIEFARRITRRLDATCAHTPWLLPHGKAMVTVAYTDGVPEAIHQVTVICQHTPEIDPEELRSHITEHVIFPALPTSLLSDATQIYINPTGCFVHGGPARHAGLTGRKLASDTYGGFARSGGGAMCGKDATKTDRCAAYAARYLAKAVVAQSLASRCEVQLSYAMGLSEPLLVSVNTFGTGLVPDVSLARAMQDAMDLRPAAIARRFSLSAPGYADLSVYGQFGETATARAWEKRDLYLIVP